MKIKTEMYGGGLVTVVTIPIIIHTKDGGQTQSEVGIAIGPKGLFPFHCSARFTKPQAKFVAPQLDAVLQTVKSLLPIMEDEIKKERQEFLCRITTESLPFP